MDSWSHTHTQRYLSYRVGISWCPSISTCLWVLDHREAMGGMQVCVNQEFLPLPNTGANPSRNSIKRPVSVLVYIYIPTFKSKLCMHIHTYLAAQVHLSCTRTYLDAHIGSSAYRHNKHYSMCTLPSIQTLHTVYRY